MGSTINLLEYYELSDEENRLSKDKAHRVEFITTTYFIDNLIKRKHRPIKILDLGAGTGKYTYYYAKNGHSVTAVDLVPQHIDAISRKINQLQNAQTQELYLGDARDLSFLEADTYDLVLCLGPLYHIQDRQEKIQCLNECKRVLKKQGILAAAYISPFAAFVNQVKKNPEKRLKKEVLHLILNQKADGRDIFCYLTPNEIEELMTELGISFLNHIGTDGVSSLVSDSINQLDDDAFTLWLSFHLQTCEERTILGSSLHGLYLGEKL